MIDDAQSWLDQEDLEELIARRPALLKEIHKENNAYGFSRVLKEYSGFPMDEPINAIIPTGVYLNAAQMLFNERESPVPAVLNYPAFRSAIWEGSDKVVVASASPFLYALALFRESFEPPVERRGTLFFPAHTVDKGRTSADWEAVARELQELEDRFQPVSACVYWEDYRKGLHRPFEKAGIRVLSAGYSFDPEFTFRWLHLLMRHRYAASNDVGSAVYYAKAAGVPVFLTKNIVQHAGDPALFLHAMNEGVAQVRETKRKLVELFRGDPDAPSEGLAETVGYLLGQESFKSPPELRADLDSVAGLGSAD